MKLFVLAALLVGSSTVFSIGNVGGKSRLPAQAAPDAAILDTCFSPGGQCDQKLVRFIGEATNTLDIAIYSITIQDIVTAIIDAKNRGVQVRMVVDRSQSKGAHSLTSTLQGAGIPLKIGNVRGIMHDKYTIVDGKKLELGSYNYTANATLDNAENQIYIGEMATVQKYGDNFKALWDSGLAN